MALTKCKQCGHTVSTQAPACPACGTPPNIQSGGFGSTLAAIAIIISFGWYFLAPDGSLQRLLNSFQTDSQTHDTASNQTPAPAQPPSRPAETPMPLPRTPASQGEAIEQLITRCVAAEDASDVTSNLAKYVGKTFDVFGFITQTPAGLFTLAGGKGDLVGQPSVNGSLACYASDAEVARKLAYSISVYEGFNISSCAVLTVTVVQRETFPKYVTVVQSGTVLHPQVMGPLSRQISSRMMNVR